MIGTISEEQVEQRTQQLGLELYRATRGYSPSLLERTQDRLMIELMEHPDFRNYLLRFEDVLAALNFEGSDERIKGLLREYFDRRDAGLPLIIRLPLALAKSPLMPAPLVGWATRFATEALASRFIAPAGIDGVLATLRFLESHKRWGSFDILGELVLSDEEATHYKDQYLHLLDRLRDHPQAGKRTPGNVAQLQMSIKLSALVADFNPVDPSGTLSRVRKPAEEVFGLARELGIGVTVDMEQYEYRELTWELFTALVGQDSSFADWTDAGVVVQAYLTDSESHLAKVFEFASSRGTPFQVRLVKGAYWDYETIVARQMGWRVPVFQDKADTDVNFEVLTKLLLRNTNLVNIAVGSHNIRSHAYAEAARESFGLRPETVEHQVLYRTAEGVTQGMASLGWMVRDYVPVGELIPGMAYLVRRVLENTSHVGFLTQNRLRASSDELLKAPSLSRRPSDAAVAIDGSLTSSDDRPAVAFKNHPPKRLFLEEERKSFQAALDKVRGEWGVEYPLMLGGEARYTAKVLRSLSPSYPNPDDPVGLVHLAGEEEAGIAIETASRGFEKWSRVSPRERAAVAQKAARIMARERDEMAAWIVHEGAKNWHGALADVDESVDYLNYYSAQLLKEERLFQESYRPRGVVAVIPPWNFPLAIPCGMTSAALIAGNAVILKSAEPTPVIAHRLVEVLHRAGVPTDALIHLPGPGRLVGAALVDSPDVDMVAFTGSKETGIRIYEQASKVKLSKGGIKRVVSEMGGKNAIVVFPDADQDEVVRGVLTSTFGHANQKCSAASRIFIHREIYERTKQRLIEGAKSLAVGTADDPATFINPVISDEAKKGILEYAEKARKEGRVLVDYTNGHYPSPYCLGPLIAEIDPLQVFTASIAREEIFGPVLTLIPFDDEVNIVALINSTNYALTAGIFSRSPKTVKRMVSAIRAGNIYVNRDITGARPGIEPFGGFQLSGTGPKAGGEDYLLAFVTRKDRGHHRRLSGSDGPSSADKVPQVRPWDHVSLVDRVASVERAISWMSGGGKDSLREAIATKEEASGEALPEQVNDIISTAKAVISAASEIDGQQPTIEIPGQRNCISWETPRGIGIVAVNDATPSVTLVGLILGPLLAGNGIVVAPGGRHGPLCDLIVKSLYDHGVPEDVLTTVQLTGLETLVNLAQRSFQFALVDLDEGDTRVIYSVLGITREAEGQNWLKALISLDEGPRPGEAGFLRLFALPKTIAIRTLRHGADLELA